MTERTVYIILTDTGTLFTRMVKLYTRNPFNHSSIAFDHHLTEVYSFGRKKPGNPFIGGFVQENINEGLFKNATCAIYSLNVKERDFNRMQQYIKKIEDQKEYFRYNLIGLFAVMMNKQLQRNNAFFCSQFVATVLSHNKSIHFEKPPSLTTPQDLLKDPALTLEYKGPLQNYHNAKNINQFRSSSVPAS